MLQSKKGSGIWRVLLIVAFFCLIPAQSALAQGGTTGTSVNPGGMFDFGSDEFTGMKPNEAPKAHRDLVIKLSEDPMHPGDFLPEVVVVSSCRSDEVSCKGTDSLLCVPKGLGAKAMARACSGLQEQVKKFTYHCKVQGEGGVSMEFARTRSEQECKDLQEAWSETWKDPVLKERYKTPGEKGGFFRKTLMKLPSKNSAGNYSFRVPISKRGRVKSLSNLRKLIYYNLSRYEDEQCGVGVLPGVDDLPILAQGNQGTCYAHVASELLDFERYHQNGTLRSYSSPLMMARDYKANSSDSLGEKDDPFGGGHACQAFNRAMKLGYCGAIDLEKRMILAASKPDGAIQKRYQRLHETGGLFKTQGKYDEEGDPVSKFLDSVGYAYENGNWAEISKIMQDLDTAQVPGSTAPACQTWSQKLADFLKPTARMAWLRSSESREDFYSRLFEHLCDRKPFPEKVACVDQPRPESPEDLDAILGMGKPLGISYCGDILDHPKMELKDCSPEGGHASIIVGTKKCQKDQCCYVVRNTWGRTNYQDAGWESQGGSVLIPKDALFRNIKSLQAIKHE